VGIPAGEVTTVHPIMLSLKLCMTHQLLGVKCPIFLLGFHYVDWFEYDMKVVLVCMCK
jgi:hypothetical protein